MPSEKEFLDWQEMMSDEQQMLSWALDNDPTSPFPEGGPLSGNEAKGMKKLHVPSPQALSVAELKWLDSSAEKMQPASIAQNPSTDLALNSETSRAIPMASSELANIQ
jgi:hypothetical protein